MTPQGEREWGGGSAGLRTNFSSLAIMGKAGLLKTWIRFILVAFRVNTKGPEWPDSLFLPTEACGLKEKKRTPSSPRDCVTLKGWTYHSCSSMARKRPMTLGFCICITVGLVGSSWQLEGNRPLNAGKRGAGPTWQHKGKHYGNAALPPASDLPAIAGALRYGRFRGKFSFITYCIYLALKEIFGF